MALASRKASNIDIGSGSSIHIPVDLSQPNTVPNVFETVKSKFGESPSVVVYNGAMFAGNDAADPLSNFDYDAYQNSVNINASSVLLALQQAVLGFKSLGSEHSKTFIFTGNFLNVKFLPGMLTFGLTKNATAYAIQHLVETKVYDKDGIA